MKYFAALLFLIFVAPSASAQGPARRIIKPSTAPRPLMNRQGIGKQEWQNPRPQSQIRQYVHPFYSPSVETRFHPNYGFYRVYRPPVINHYYGPPVIVYPRSPREYNNHSPFYPSPFQGFFFQFRF